jgi:ribonuclease HI
VAIESCKTQNPFILKIVEIYKSLVAIGKHVIFTWIPSHIGIHGNTVVDREAKNVLDDLVSNCSKERESEQMNLLFSEEATNFKARSIALASALKIELANTKNQKQTLY